MRDSGDFQSITDQHGVVPMMTSKFHWIGLSLIRPGCMTQQSAGVKECARGHTSSYFGTPPIHRS